MRRRLVIAYNANTGLLAGASDYVHKLISPATYPCALCALTYGLVGMRRPWRDFLASTGLPVVFHHRPDFRAAFPACDWPLPLLAVAEDDALRLLVGAGEMASLPDLDALIGLTRSRL